MAEKRLRRAESIGRAPPFSIQISVLFAGPEKIVLDERPSEPSVP